MATSQRFLNKILLLRRLCLGEVQLINETGHLETRGKRKFRAPTIRFESAINKFQATPNT